MSPTSFMIHCVLSQGEHITMHEKLNACMIHAWAVCVCMHSALPPTLLLQPALGDGWGRAVGKALREGRGRSAVMQTFTSCDLCTLPVKE